MRHWLAALLIHGPDRDFIRADLDEMYVRDRARGISLVRAHARFLRRLLASAFDVWRSDIPDSHPAPRASGPRMWGQTMRDDFRFGLRLCRKRPGPVIVAIGGLAVAIAIVASVFTIVDNTMLKPYGMEDPASVVTVAGEHGWSEWRYSRFAIWRDEVRDIRLEAARLQHIRYTLSATGDEGPARYALFVSGGYLGMLGGKPALGRLLGPADDEAGAPLVAVLSHRFWTTAFAADSRVVGRSVWLNGSPVTIVGVLDPVFTGPTSIRPSIWMPLAGHDDIAGGPATGPSSDAIVEVVGRLLGPANPVAIEQQLTAIAARSAPGSVAHAPRRPPVVRILGASSPMSGRDATESLLTIGSIFGLVALVLIVACANTANLLFAVATTRQHEMGVRLSLGASTRRLTMQVINESVLLALIAGSAGLLCSLWLSPWLASTLALSPEVATMPGPRTLIFTTAIALVCGLGAGLSPARYGARGQILRALQNESGNHGGTGRSTRRQWLSAIQAAVSIFLLVAAALFARTSFVTSTMDFGFDTDRVVALSLGGTRVGVNEAAYIEAATATLRALPSVERVSLTERAPWGWSHRRVRFDSGGRSYVVNVTGADEEFFAAAGLRVLRGRAFTRDEAARQAPVALISESVARAFFVDGNAIGQPLSRLPIPDLDLEQDVATIIGITADALLTPMDGEVYGSIHRPVRRLATDVTKAVMLPAFLIRTIHPARTAREAERALRAIDPKIIPEPIIVRERIDSFVGWKQMFAWLSVPTGAFVLFLSLLGLFGVTSFVVHQRMPEMSIRLALGASQRSVRTLLLRQSLRPVVVGLAVGLFAALLLARLTARAFNLSGISPHDPVSIGTALIVLLTGALTAVLIPARRAARSNPANLLRRG